MLGLAERPGLGDENFIADRRIDTGRVMRSQAVTPDFISFIFLDKERPKPFDRRRPADIFLDHFPAEEFSLYKNLPVERAFPISTIFLWRCCAHDFCSHFEYPSC